MQGFDSGHSLIAVLQVRRWSGLTCNLDTESHKFSGVKGCLDHAAPCIALQQTMLESLSTQ